MRIVCAAEAWGFGPVSKLITVIEPFLETAECVFLGKGCAVDFAKLHPLKETWCIETPVSDSRVPAILTDADVFLNVMDRDYLPFTSLCPMVYVDILFWFWETAPLEAANVARYFVQNWLGLEQRVTEWRSVLPTLELVGPIMREVPVAPAKCRENKVVIGFGGMDNPYVTTGINSEYPFVMLENILPVLKSLEIGKVVVTGRGRILAELAERFPSPKIVYRMLSRQEMLQELASASCFLTAPGLESMLDAAMCQTPCFYLLPQNNSNLVQLQMYREYGIGDYSVAFADVFPEFTFERNHDQSVEMAKIIGYLQKLSTLPQIGVLQEKLRQFFADRNRWHVLVEKQTKLLRSLGGNGVERVRETVLDLGDSECKRKTSKLSLSI